MPGRTIPGESGCSGEASAGDGACPREKVQVKEEKEKKSKKRIVDYLHEPQDDDEMDEHSRKSCDLYPSPPILAAASSALPAPPGKAAAAAGDADAASLSSSLRSLLIEKPSALRSAWFTWSGRHGKKKNEVKRGRRSAQKERRTGKMTPLAPETVGEETRKVARLPPCCSSTSGGKPAEASFNMGMGLGMAFILAKWATEFGKMTELRVQMEMLLKEIKGEVPMNCVSPNILESERNCASSSSHCCREIGTENSIFPQSQQMLLPTEGSNSAMESSRHSNCEASSQSEECPRMEELEAELELELEQLQLNLEEDFLVQSEQETMEMISDSTKSCESFHDDSEPKDEDYTEYYGVSARELERRLHELLHTRQRERIAELEAALKLVLIEKEIEVSKWRKAAINATNRANTFDEVL